MLDLAVVGGTVVTGSSIGRVDIGVKDGQVVLLAAPGALPSDAAQVVDARSMTVVPGGIDSHVHFDISLTDALRAQSSASGSRAAAFGGTTTFIDFGLQHGAQSPIQAVQDKLGELKSGAPHVDYALHLMVTGHVPLAAMDEIPDVVTGGAPSLKMFTTFSAGSASGDLFSDDGRILGVMEKAAAAGGSVMVHCEDNCIIGLNVDRLYAAGRETGRNIHLARPILAEEAAIRRMTLLAERSGCPLYVVHVSSEAGIAAIGESKRRGAAVYGEVLHNYLAYTSQMYQQPDYQRFHNYPPLKYQSDQDALWAAIASGGLDTVASDDLTIPRAAKVSGDLVDNVPGGHNGIETRMEYLYSEGVLKGRITAQQYVRLTAETPAKLFGLYPRKGTIAIGSDADFAVIDTRTPRAIALSDLHSDCDYSIWEGWTFNARLHATVLRGSVLTLAGEWVGPEHAGQFVEGRAG
ncbi:MAG TPA: amidohydrolase family protein [Jatrophihabitans sp.]|nr:amidohydrolase family protein [Jatrophihabitans sp.]